MASVTAPRPAQNIIHPEREPLNRREFPAVMRFLEREQVAAYLQPSSWQYSVLLVAVTPGLPRVGEEPRRRAGPHISAYVNVDRSGMPLCMPEPDCYVSAALNP